MILLLTLLTPLTPLTPLILLLSCSYHTLISAHTNTRYLGFLWYGKSPCGFMTVCPCFYLLFPFRQHLIPLLFFTSLILASHFHCFPLSLLPFSASWVIRCPRSVLFVYLIPLLSCNNSSQNSQNSTFRIFQNCCPPIILLFTLACRIFNINLNFNTNVIILWYLHLH